MTLEWFDSEDPTNRRRALMLHLSRPDSQRGTLYRCERDNPSDIWPASTRVGGGYSRTSAAKIAKREGLVAA